MPLRRKFLGRSAIVPLALLPLTALAPREPTPPDLRRYVADLYRADPGRGCLFAEPGRGDCLHFVGLPDRFVYPETVDEYGIPHGWCRICWQIEEIGALRTELRALRAIE